MARWYVSALTSTAELGDLPRGKQLARAPSPRECSVAAVSPDGQRIAIGCNSDVRVGEFPTYPAPRALRIYPVARLWR